MALYKSRTTGVTIAAAGTTVAHGLAVTPTAVYILPSIAAGAGQTYRYTGFDATNVYLAQGTTSTSADVVCEFFHSMTD